jgi:hypothetical protein
MDGSLKISEIHALGYAVPFYNINNDKRSWSVGGERVITLPADAVPVYELDGLQYKVAKIKDVLAKDAE